MGKYLGAGLIGATVALMAVWFWLTMAPLPQPTTWTIVCGSAPEAQTYTWTGAGHAPRDL